jgi:hypothetical protein
MITLGQASLSLKILCLLLEIVAHIINGEVTLISIYIQSQVGGAYIY